MRQRFGCCERARSSAWSYARPRLKAESLSDQQIQKIDVSVVSVGLGAAYRINPYITVFGGYSFLRQRVGQSSTTQDFDADANRVKVGIQFGYPIAFDL